MSINPTPKRWLHWSRHDARLTHDLAQVPTGGRYIEIVDQSADRLVSMFFAIASTEDVNVRDLLSTMSAHWPSAFKPADVEVQAMMRLLPRGRSNVASYNV